MRSLANLTENELIDFLKNQANIEHEGRKLYDGTGTHIIQNPYELAELVTWIKSLNSSYSPNNFLEIGYSAGITNTVLCKIFDFKSITSIDHITLGGTANPYTFIANLKHKPITLIAGDSTSDETILKAKALGPYDFLFIDGGHTDEILHSDYVNYTKLMRQNSLIVVHDIYSSSYPTLNLVWNKIKNSLPPNAVFKEFIRESAPITLGIGAIYLKEGNY